MFLLSRNDSMILSSSLSLVILFLGANAWIWSVGSRKYPWYGEIGRSLIVGRILFNGELSSNESSPTLERADNDIELRSRLVIGICFMTIILPVRASIPFTTSPVAPLPRTAMQHRIVDGSSGDMPRPSPIRECTKSIELPSDEFGETTKLRTNGCGGRYSGMYNVSEFACCDCHCGSCDCDF